MRSGSGSPDAQGDAERPRRRRGDGHLRRLPEGGYQLRVSLGVDGTGRRLQRAVRGRTLKEVAAKRDALLERHRAGAIQTDPRASRLTLGAYLEGWLREKRPQVVFSAWRQYRAYLTGHVVPRLGALRLVDVTTPVVRELYAALQAESGLAPQSVLHLHRALSQALKGATEDGLVLRNPCAGVRPGKVPPSLARALTEDEAVRLLGATSGDWRCLWLLGLTTGLRLGELLGLPWAAVELERAGGETLTVRQALVEDGDGVPVVREYPKSRAGNRSVPLLPEAVEALRDQRRRQLAERLRAREWPLHPPGSPQELVFLTRRGTPHLASNAGRAFKRSALSAGVPLRKGEGPYLLRHTYASHLLAEGRPVTEVAMLMGHASAATTMAVYAHWVRNDLSAAREAIRRAYGLSGLAATAQRPRPSPTSPDPA